MQNPAPARLDLFMALPTHGQSRVHMDVVAGEIQGNQALEQDGPSRKGRGQEHQETGSRAAVGDHVQHRTKSCGLIVPPRCQAVRGIEKARDTVQTRTRPRMKGHVVERSKGEDDSGISCNAIRQRGAQRKEKGARYVRVPMILGINRKMFSSSYMSSSTFSTVPFIFAWPLARARPLLSEAFPILLYPAMPPRARSRFRGGQTRMKEAEDRRRRGGRSLVRDC